MTDLADSNKRAVPGQPDMWAFVLFETLVFTAYFGFYLFYRAHNPELFLHSQAQLDLRIGVFNTLVLLLSSWSVARCVQSARAGAYRAALRTCTSRPPSPQCSSFQGVGVGPAGRHRARVRQRRLLHLLLLSHRHPLRAPADRLRRARRHRLPNPQGGAKSAGPVQAQQLVETCATYWHTVDFLWVLIFALLYVVR